MLHHKPLQLFLICLLRLIILYKESTALIHNPENVRHSSFEVESHDFLAM